MAAEMPGGLLLQNKIKNSGQNIAMLLVGSSSKFTKKAVGKIYNLGSGQPIKIKKVIKVEYEI